MTAPQSPAVVPADPATAGHTSGQGPLPGASGRLAAVGEDTARRPDDDYLRALVIPICDRSGRVISSTIVDPDIYPAINRWCWSTDTRGYAIRMVRVDGKQQTIRMHRQIMCCVPGDGLEIDHINRCKLDNRRSNLRYATHTENVNNREPIATRPRYLARRKRWVVAYQRDRKPVHVGSFQTFDEAMAASQRAAEQRRRAM